MTPADAPRRSALPRGALASTVLGGAAGVVAWFITGAWPLLTTSYGRLDQLSALTMGVVTGAAVLGTRALRQRAPVALAVITGALFGGVPALLGGSIALVLQRPVSPMMFVLERIGVWAFVSLAAVLALHAVLLRTVSREERYPRLRESGLIAAIGGGIAGVIFTLPGPSDAWQAGAFAWWGAVVGLALAGPELWRATAIVETLPARRKRPGLFSLREWPLYDGMSLDLGEAKLACTDGGVAVYPPAGGVVSNGHFVHSSQWLPAATTLSVGRARHRIRLLRVSE